MRAVLVLLVLILALVALFVFQNPEPVTVRFFGFTGITQLLAVIVLSFGAGALAAFLAAIPARLKLRRKVRELEKAAEAPPNPPTTEKR